MSHTHPLNPYRASASDMLYKDRKLFLIDNRNRGQIHTHYIKEGAALAPKLQEILTSTDAKERKNNTYLQDMFFSWLNPTGNGDSLIFLNICST